MLSIKNYNLTPTKIPFRAETVKSENNAESKPTFKSNYGLKTGAVYAAIASGLSLLGVTAQGLNLKREQKRLDENMGRYSSQKQLEFIQKTKTSLKRTWITIPLGVAIIIGCGALVDKLINKKHTDLAEQVKSKPAKEILEENDNVEVSKNGNLYYKSNTGMKTGPLIGAIVAPISSMVALKIAKFRIHPILAITGLIQGALGGLLLGSITDYCSNKAAEKYADKK